MDGIKILLAGAAVIVVGFFAYKALSNSRYEPILFMGEQYTHVEKTEVNKVENHFFTPGGVDVNDSGRFIQISKYDHPDLTADMVSRVQAQVISGFALRALPGSDDRFFGLFRGTVPVYGYMRADAFVLHAGPNQANPDNAALLADAAARIDELSGIPTGF